MSLPTRRFALLAALLTAPGCDATGSHDANTVSTKGDAPRVDASVAPECGAPVGGCAEPVSDAQAGTAVTVDARVDLVDAGVRSTCAPFLAPSATYLRGALPSLVDTCTVDVPQDFPSPTLLRSCGLTGVTLHVGPLSMTTWYDETGRPVGREGASVPDEPCEGIVPDASCASMACDLCATPFAPPASTVCPEFFDAARWYVAPDLPGGSCETALSTAIVLADPVAWDRLQICVRVDDVVCGTECGGTECCTTAPDGGGVLQLTCAGATDAGCVEDISGEGALCGGLIARSDGRVELDVRLVCK